MCIYIYFFFWLTHQFQIQKQTSNQPTFSLPAPFCTGELPAGNSFLGNHSPGEDRLGDEHSRHELGVPENGGKLGEGTRWAPTSYKWSYNPYK